MSHHKGKAGDEILKFRKGPPRNHQVLRTWMSKEGLGGVSTTVFMRLGQFEDARRKFVTAPVFARAAGAKPAARKKAPKAVAAPARGKKAGKSSAAPSAGTEAS